MFDDFFSNAALHQVRSRRAAVIAGLALQIYPLWCVISWILLFFVSFLAFIPPLAYTYQTDSIKAAFAGVSRRRALERDDAGILGQNMEM